MALPLTLQGTKKPPCILRGTLHKPYSPYSHAITGPLLRFGGAWMGDIFGLEACILLDIVVAEIYHCMSGSLEHLPSHRVV